MRKGSDGFETCHGKVSRYWKFLADLMFESGFSWKYEIIKLQLIPQGDLQPLDKSAAGLFEKLLVNVGGVVIQFSRLCKTVEELQLKVY